MASYGRWTYCRPIPFKCHKIAAAKSKFDRVILVRIVLCFRQLRCLSLFYRHGGNHMMDNGATNNKNTFLQECTIYIIYVVYIHIIHIYNINLSHFKRRQGIWRLALLPCCNYLAPCPILLRPIRTMYIFVCIHPHIAMHLHTDVLCIYT